MILNSVKMFHNKNSFGPFTRRANCIAIFAILSVSFGLKTTFPTEQKTDAGQEDDLKLCCPFPNLHENLDFQLTSLMNDKIINQLLITRFCPASKLLVHRLNMFLS